MDESPEDYDVEDSADYDEEDESPEDYDVEDFADYDEVDEE